MIKLHSDNRTIHALDGAKEVELSKAEFNVLSCLIDHYPDVCARESIIEQAWEGRIVSDGSVNVVINGLRKKINLFEIGNVIESERGIGYKLLIRIIKSDENKVHLLKASIGRFIKKSIIEHPLLCIGNVFLFVFIVSFYSTYFRFAL